MQNPDNLYIYRLARELVPPVYAFIETLPASERYNLQHQMRRSSTSIRDNIRDGCGRQSNRAALPKYYDAHSSAMELVGQFQQALDVRIGNAQQARHLRSRADHLRFSIMRYIKSLERRL